MGDRKASGDGDDQKFRLRASNARAATGSTDENLALVLINQVSRTLWRSGGLSEAQVINAAMAAMKGLAPRDELEGMLAAQMVATHTAAMECLRRAMIDGQTFEGRDQNSSTRQSCSACMRARWRRSTSTAARDSRRSLSST